MNSVIQNTISQYFSSFIETISSKYNLSQEELEEIWRQTQKEKIKIRPQRRASGNRKPSPYINFCNHQRKLLKENQPDLSFGDTARTLGKLWTRLDIDEKKKYSDPLYDGKPENPVVKTEEEAVKTKPKRNRKSNN